MNKNKPVGIDAIAHDINGFHRKKKLASPRLFWDLIGTFLMKNIILFLSSLFCVA